MNRRVIDKIRMLAVALCALSVVSFGQQADPGTGDQNATPPGGFEFTPGKPVIEFPHDQKKDYLRYDPETGKWTNPNGTPFDPGTVYDEAAKAAWTALSLTAEMQAQINALGVDVAAFLESGGTLDQMFENFWQAIWDAADERYKGKDDDSGGGSVTWDNIEGKPDPFQVTWANVTDRPQSGVSGIDALEKLTIGDGSITAQGNTITIADGLVVSKISSSRTIAFSYDALANKPLTATEWEEHKAQNSHDVENLTEMIAALNDGVLPAAATNLLATVAFSGSYNDLSDAPELGGSAETTVVNKDGDNFTFVMKNIIVTNGMLQATDADGDGITLKKLASTAAWADIENKPSLYTTEEVDALIEANKCTCTPGEGGGGSGDGECHCEGCGGGDGGSTGGNCSCSIKSAEDVNDAELDPIFSLWEAGFYVWQDSVNTDIANLKRMERALYDLVQTLASQAIKPGILPGLF